MRRRSLILMGAVLIVASAAAAGGGASSPSKPQSPSAACPHGALPLPANPLGRAGRAALRHESPQGEPRVTAAVIASTESTRADYVKRRCGRRAWRRTIVVTIDRRAYHPSASASLGVYAVSRFAGGFRAWNQLH